jgi:transcriptional regulator with XRE-family HTH domain
MVRGIDESREGVTENISNGDVETGSLDFGGDGEGGVNFYRDTAPGNRGWEGNVHTHILGHAPLLVKPPGATALSSRENHARATIASEAGHNEKTTVAGEGWNNNVDISSPTISQCLAAWRTLRGLSQEEAAVLSGISRNTINRAERGHGLRYSTLEALARAYGAPSVAALQSPPGASTTLDINDSRVDNPGGSVSTLASMSSLSVALGGIVFVPSYRGIPATFTEDDPLYERRDPAHISWGAPGELHFVTLPDDSCHPHGKGSLACINIGERKPQSQRPVLVEFADGTRAVRLYVRTEKGAWVEPMNRAWGPPVPMSTGVTILGRVRAWVSEEA